MDGKLASGVAYPRTQVMPVKRLEPLQGQETNPEKRRHTGIGRVLSCPTCNIEVGFLEYVGRVDSPR